MKVGILDLDTKKEKMGNGLHERFPNIACGKIYGYHVTNGDEVIYPWKWEKVDRLYVSAIFSWSKKAVEKQLELYRQYADDVIIGGTGWDWKTKLPAEIELVDSRWTYDMYGIDYGIGFTLRGCHVGCGFCVVPRKEGTKEYRVATIPELINSKSNHVVLLNNNSFADLQAFYEDVEEIKGRGLTVNWNQANDITLVTPDIAAALASVEYRNFAKTEKTLHFSFDQMIKRKIDPRTGKRVEFDMMKTVAEQITLLNEYGIRGRNLTFYMLIGYDTTLEEDLARVALLKQHRANIFAMQFRDLTGKVGVDGTGRPQLPHVKHLKRWVNSFLYKSIPFHEYAEYQREMNKGQQMQLFG